MSPCINTTSIKTTWNTVLYVQTIHLFTEQRTMDLQTYPYMEELYHWEDVNTVNQRHRCFKNTAGWQILTIDPYIGRALCGSPLIGGLARIQALVLPCDTINMEGPIFWWYHNTWIQWYKVWIQNTATCLCLCLLLFFLFFFTWSLRQSTFILVPRDGWGWDALRGTAKNHWAADVDGTICQIIKQHWRLQNWNTQDMNNRLCACVLFGILSENSCN